jgi:hypothetical protein
VCAAHQAGSGDMVRLVPDSGGVLSEQEKATAFAWLTTHWSNTPCPFHPQRPMRWEIGDVLIQTLPFSGIGGGLLLGGQTYPLLPVSCSDCGYTVFVNAIKAGVVIVPPASTAPEGGEATVQTKSAQNPGA